MATVGLSFGAAASGTGFDVASTVTSILAISSAIETPWKNRLTALQAQDAALTSLGTNLSSLATAVSALTNFDGVLAMKQGSSSDTNVLTLASASSVSTAGSHSVVVSSLAQTASQYSDKIANAADTLSGTISFRVGSCATQSLTLDSTNNTLSTLAAAINGGSFGVSASIVTDSGGARLSLVSRTDGAAGALSINANLTDTATAAKVGFSVGQVGADAQLTVDGLAISSASNTVTGAIPGVTFHLLSTSAGAPVQVQIENDNSDVETAVQSLVTAYNAVVISLKAQEGKDANGNAQPLFGNPTLALIQNQLATSLLSGAGSGAIKNIGQLGLALGQDGKLTLDVSRLDSALNSSFSDVTGYLQDANGFGQTLAKALDTLGTETPGGAVALALQQNATDELNLNDSVSAEEALLADEKTRLTTELTTANQILQSIPQQLSAQTQIYNAITGYKGG